MRAFLIVVFTAITFSASAQILNVESLRKVTDTSGFSGSASLDFSLKRDKNNYFEFSTDALIQYKMKRHLVLWKNDVTFKNIAGNKFQNSGVTHLRYSYKVYPQISLEMFAQAQYNKVSKIGFRGLLGIGPRFKLTTSEDYKVYLGTHLMYEQEELDNEISIVRRHFRNSTYLSFSLYPTDRITVVSTTYYQPKLSAFKDYRLSSETSFLINIFSQFSFKTSYTFIYDEYPAEGIPNSQYNLTSGIVYVF